MTIGTFFGFVTPARACAGDVAHNARMKVVPPGVDPRRHLTAALGWAMFVVVVLAALIAANLAAGAAERRVRADAEQLLAQFAQQAQRTLASALATRVSMLTVTASQIAASGDRSPQALRRHVRAIAQGFSEFVWLGVTDAEGGIVAAAGRVPENAAASAHLWLDSARHGPWLGDVHAAGAPARAGPGAEEAGVDHVIDAAAPLLTADGTRHGVVGAYLAWNWIEGLQAELERSFTTHRPVELWLAASDGTILSGPPAWRGRSLRAQGDGADPTEAGAYLVRRAALGDAPEVAALHWTVLVRQRTDLALADARTVQHAVFGIVLVAGLLAAAAAIVVTRRMLGRLVRLADDARAVQRGERTELARPAGHDEIAGIGAALADAVAQLQAEKRVLQALNAELDARVVERTARIERLAGDQRHAAVVRVRLRLARELHDTLAHSLMALLTQIRLARKLRGRVGDADLDAELARAEEVAASGLAEARAAIAQMRHNAVRDSGLGDALRELLERFAQRTGIEHELHVEGAAGALAGERAETAFRIAEEALNNVERHAQARLVRVTLSGGEPPLSGAPRRVRLEVADDGVGFDAAPEHPGHYGLRGIREQAALIEARLEIDSAPRTGTRIALEFDD